MEDHARASHIRLVLQPQLGLAFTDLQVMPNAALHNPSGILQVGYCRWGPLLEEATYKSKYRVYLSEQVRTRTSAVTRAFHHNYAPLQTDDSEPQKLKIVTAEVCKVSCDTVAQARRWWAATSVSSAAPRSGVRGGIVLEGHEDVPIHQGLQNHSPPWRGGYTLAGVVAVHPAVALLELGACP
jgi:hypothetical protein